ncbi:MAG: hypothetical protein HUU46_24230 [Candidatus Hydrogenedentes bacterium]|nr:hypothetical protein [Candidatus Hydrogenedentota bacterium]
MDALTPAPLFLQPDLRRKRVQASLLERPPGPVRVTVEGTPYSSEGELATLIIDLPEFQPWSPDNPALIAVRCETGGTNPATPLAARFGMRECTLKDNRFHLNTKPILLRGVVLEAADVASCADESGAQGLVARLKRAGFNFLRARGGPIPARVLDAADELGLLVCDELDPNGGMQTVDATVMARRNHPSIVIWHIAQSDDSGSAMRHVHQLDPSRIVVTALDALEGDSRFMRPYQDEIGALDSAICHLPSPSSGRAERFYEHVGEPGMPVLLASFGTQPALTGIGLSGSDAALDRELADREIDRVLESAAHATTAIQEARGEALVLQIAAARVNAKVAGYCVDGLPDVDAAGFARVQTPLMLAIRASRTNLVPREEVPVAVTIVNDDRSEPLADLSLQVVGPTNQVLWKKKRSIKVPKQTRDVWTGTISASGSVGVHKFVVRLMQGMKLLAQNRIDLQVVEPAPVCDVEVSVLDPHGEWTERCTAPAKPAGTKPRVYIVPPLTNTVRAYPETELINLLNEVRAGAVAIVFSPPADWNDLAERIDDALKATTVDVFGGFHYVRLHPVFDGLPSRCLMRQAYRNIVPRRSFEEQSDERMCGTIAARSGDDAPWFGEDMLVRRFGSGRMVFTHARVLEHLGSDPVADRLYLNLIRHFGRRSVPGEITQPIQQSVLDWLRRERSERARLWSLIGPFPNWGGAGHDTKYPPEQQVDLTAIHAGWRDPVRWTRWYVIGEVRNEIDFDAALGLPFAGPVSTLPETFYAYAECAAPTRQAATMRVRLEGCLKVFINGTECHSSSARESDSTSREETVPLTFKQGKNAILIKLARDRRPARLSVETTSATRDPLILKWWR